MHVFIRADASITIGQGHVMRCLTLAGAFREQGLISTFVCREHPGNLCDLIEGNGFAVNRLCVTDAPSLGDEALSASWQEDAAQTGLAIDRADVFPRWLVVDHYALDARWERRLRPSVEHIMVIDDLADRPHDADLLLDQNLYPNVDLRYTGLIEPGCKTLLGPKYALLRPEFADARKNPRLRDGSIRRILVFFGGSDATNETGKALDAIAVLNLPNVEFDVVIGASNPRKDALVARCAGWPNIRLHCQVSHMGALMDSADLALGAGGSATWERCATGLPSLVISVADNQVAIAKGVNEANAHRYLGTHTEVSARMLAEAVILAQENPATLEQMSRAGRALVDAHGSVRVVDALQEVV